MERKVSPIVDVEKEGSGFGGEIRWPMSGRNGVGTHGVCVFLFYVFFLLILSFGFCFFIHPVLTRPTSHLP